MLTSQLIHPINQFGKLGKIHSVFGQSFNINIQNQLIHIGSYRKYISSFGSFMEREQYESLKPYLQIGNVVRVTDNSISIYSRVGVGRVDISDEVTDLKVHSIAPNKELIEKLNDAMNDTTDRLQIGLPMDDEFDHIYNLLTTQQLDEVGWDLVVKYMIGRGKGLTPSGDDMMLAYLFVMTLFNPERATRLSLALTKQPLSTTDVSKEYILSCVKGYVSSPVHSLYILLKENATQKQLEESIVNIMNIGHTSGRDMVFGIKMGINYILNT